MKKQNKQAYSLIVIISIALLISSCTKDAPVETSDPSQNTASIEEYISKLNYNPETLLNYQNTGGQEAARDVIKDTTETTKDGNFTTVCKTTTFNLKKNFDRVAILRPTNGIVWTGALVKGNQSLMDGVPEPIGIERAPVTFSINLPGIGEHGIRTVKNPQASNIQAAIDSSLEWWNNNAYEDGYVNAANSSFHLSSSYSSKQLGLDVSLNSEWASGNVSSQFNYFSSEKKKVIVAVFKQAFYDVIFDTPTSPEKVFAKGTSLDKVKRVMTAADAPAYIKSVTYGRIIMFRMTATSSYKSADVEAAFRYAAGYSVDGSLESTYKSILRESSIDLVTIGGNAAVATEPISSANVNSATSILNKIRDIISGDNAVYSRNNPGVPIAYSVFYLKDNSLAKLGYTTEYTAKECVTTQKSNTISVYLGNFTAIKDCDGIEGAGDFKVRVQILNENNGRIVSDYPSNNNYKSLTLNDNDKYLINKTKTFTLPKSAGKKFTVKLIVYEKDKNIFGHVYNDSRMNGKTATGVFSFDNGSWSPPASSYTLYIGDGNCKVKLDYKVTIQ